MSSDHHQFKVNLPTDVKEWLAEQAKANLRSQTSEIILALREKMQRENSYEKAPARS
ncbi:Arc family DNA-binding protein [Agrobacterium tumefaciens]|nr:Arc family DNA-binding protein [Agrobacterium tumefaciens]